MKYYPIFLRVAGRPCLVIGGGKVGEQKVRSLLKAGACVTLIAPQVTRHLAALAQAKKIRYHARRYRPGDLHGMLLVFAATNDDQVQAQIAGEAKDSGVLLNAVDRPQLCDFVAAAIVQRGDLTIATSTGGASPALAKRIRRDLETAFGPEYAVALELLRRVRAHLGCRQRDAIQRRRIFRALVDSPLLDYLRAGRADAVDRLLARTVGADVSLERLGLDRVNP